MYDVFMKGRSFSFHIYIWVCIYIYIYGYCNAILVFIKQALSECVVSRSKQKLLGFMMLLQDW